jgi:hypothetical protein
MVFEPNQMGARSATLVISDGTVSVSAALTGTAVPSATLTPVTRDFGTVAVGQQSAGTLFTLTNTGISPFSFVVGRSGANPLDFPQQGGTCSGPLAGGASCTLNIFFEPNQAGPRSATLTVSNSLQSVSAALTGTATSLSASLTPMSRDFGSVALGGAAPLTTFTLTNTSGALINFTVSNTGANPLDFPRQGGTCSTSLAAGASCTMNIGFEPNLMGPRSATLTVAIGSVSVTAALSGTGVPSLTLSPTSRDFGSVAVGQQSPGTVFTLTNISLIPVSFTVGRGGTNPLDFPQQGGTCAGSLAAGASCTMNVFFEPNQVGARSATLNVDNTVGSSVQRVTAGLTGLATSGAAPISNLVVNDTSAANAGTDGVPNNQQWSIQTNFRTGVPAFGDRTVNITSVGTGTLGGKAWIRTAADSKTFAGSPLATFTVNGQFVYLLVDDRHNTGSKPAWLDATFTDQGFNATILEGTTTRQYSVWRKTVTPGSTVTLPTINSAIAPCYLVVVE